MPSYYNTTGEGGDDLDRYRVLAERQERAVFRFFASHPGMIFPPSKVWQLVIPQAPLTSTRRAMTNLTTAGRLEKTDWKSVGLYGRPEFCWRLAE